MEKCIKVAESCIMFLCGIVSYCVTDNFWHFALLGIMFILSSYLTTKSLVIKFKKDLEYLQKLHNDSMKGYDDLRLLVDELKNKFGKSNPLTNERL